MCYEVHICRHETNGLTWQYRKCIPWQNWTLEKWRLYWLLMAGPPSQDPLQGKGYEFSFSTFQHGSKNTPIFQYESTNVGHVPMTRSGLHSFPRNDGLRIFWALILSAGEVLAVSRVTSKRFPSIHSTVMSASNVRRYFWNFENKINNYIGSDEPIWIAKFRTQHDTIVFTI